MSSSRSAASIAELYEWPNGVPGATWRCLQNGTPLQDKRYALYPDRVVAREIGMFAYDPPLEIFRVPVDVGDEWQTAWMSPSVTEGMSSWIVVEAERIDLPFGSFEAAKIELTSTSSAGTSVTTMWWVDGIGTVRALNDEFRYDLVAFTPP